MRPWTAAWVGLLLVACEGRGPAPGVERAPADPAAPAAEARPVEAERLSGDMTQQEIGAAARAGQAPPSAVLPDGRRVYGAPVDDGAIVPLSAIAADPAGHRGRTVTTEGEIKQVCQRMGCWMELQDPGSEAAVRVPMARHGFFLPHASAGRHAVVQGQVEVRELTAEERDHFASEGATVLASALSIQATGVVIHPAR